MSLPVTALASASKLGDTGSLADAEAFTGLSEFEWTTDESLPYKTAALVAIMTAAATPDLM